MKTIMIKTKGDEQIDQRPVLILFLVLFFLIYFICTILLQIRSHKAPSVGGSVFDIFIGSLLMSISLISILIAIQRLNNNILSLFLWLSISATAGALAIDEWFEFHEYTDLVEGGWWAFGEDDYIKIALCFCTGIGIYILNIKEKLPKEVLVFFLIGFLFQFFYLIVEMGDGEFFTLPIRLNKLRWVEEILEVFFVESYLGGILLFHQNLYLSSKLTNNTG